MYTPSRDAQVRQSIIAKAQSMVQTVVCAFVILLKKGNSMLRNKGTMFAFVALFVIPLGMLLPSLSLTPTQAATSNQLNFQGRLLTSTGGLVPDGTYNMQFNLYYASTGGSSQWTETRLNTASQGVTIRNGYFSAYLGDVTAFPSSINWSENLYLGMTVRGSGSCAWGSCTPADSEMTPRFKLTSVPYAFRASNVASSSTNQTSTNSDQVSITTGNATGSSSNSGNITVDTGTATGTTGTISVGSTNASALTLGRSGITTTNAGALTVSQLLTASGGLTIAGGTNYGIYYRDASGNVVTSVAGTTGQCLVANSGAAPGWGTCGGGGGGSSLFTDAGTFTYLTATTNDFVLGASTIAGAALYLDVSTTSLYVGTNGVSNGVLTLYSSGSSIAPPTISVSSTGNLTLSAPDGTVVVGSGSGAVAIGGSSSIFALDSTALDISTTGAITGATGITSSGTITFSGLNTAGIVTNTAAGVLGTVSTIPVSNGGTGVSSFQSNGILYGNGAGTIQVTAAGTTNQCLLANTDAAPAWGSCTADGAGILNQNTSTQTATYRISGSGQADGGLLAPSLDTATATALNIGTTTQNALTIGRVGVTTTINGSSIALGGNTTLTGTFIQKSSSANSFQLQNATGAVNLMFTNGTSGIAGENHLRIYEPTARTLYVDIWADTTGAYFSSSEGTTTIGNGIGNVDITLTNASELFTYNKNYTPVAAYSINDFTVTRTLSSSAQALTGKIFSVIDNSATSNATFSPDMLYILQNNSSATGNLILAQTGASVTKFSVNTAGNTTIAGTLAVTGAVTASTGLSVTGGTTNINASSNFATNINTGTSTGAISIGNALAGAASLQTGSTFNLTAAGALTVTSSSSFVLSSTNFNVTSLGVVTIVGGQAADITSVAGSGTGAGAAITVRSGTGGATGAGGALTLQGGTGGATSGAGGLVTIQGGNATLGASNGGGVSILGGASTTTGVASAITLTAGAGVAASNTAGGAINITSGAGGGSAAGGLLTVRGGTGGATGAGGGISIITGAGGATSGASGSLNLQSGNVTSGTAGNISIDVGTSTSSNGSILIGTAARAQTINVGNTTGATALNLKSGSGAISLNASVNNATNINTGSSTGEVSIGNSAAGVISIQSASTIGLIGTATITGLTGGSATALTVDNSTSTGSIFVAQDNGTAVVTIEDGGAATFQNSVNSTAAFSVQTAGSVTLLGIDTTNSFIYSTIADGASAVGFKLNTSNTFTSSGAKLLSVQNNGTERFAIDKNGHLVSGSPAPSAVTVDANAGTGDSPSCTITGNETVGTITIVTGSGAQTAGDWCSATIDYSATPRPVVSGVNKASTALMPYISATTTTLTFGVNLTGDASTTYTYNYFMPQ
jgi:hypothetical protein